MPLEMQDGGAMAQTAVEAIIGNASLRDELTDDEAQPLIDWGVAQAEILAALAEQTELPDETLEEHVSNLRKFIRRINRLVGRRASSDEAAIQKDLERLVKYGSRLWGEDMPAPDEPTVQGFLAEHTELSNGDVVRRLLAMYAPPADPVALRADPDTPPADPDTPPADPDTPPANPE